MKIIVINPGSTSTKVAYFENDTSVFEAKIEHPAQQLDAFQTVADQKELRFGHILHTLRQHLVPLEAIDGIAARGGLLPPLSSGAYEINDAMLDYLIHRPRAQHASNLGALLASELKQVCSDHTRCFIYDPVTVDELAEISRVSGLNGIERESIGHALNTRAVAMDIAQKIGTSYEQCTIIVAHLGGGNTINIHDSGRITDLLSDDEGPFSTERTGALPIKKVIEWCNHYSKEEMTSFYRKKGGLLSYLGTNDLREVEMRIEAKDSYAALILDAMSYQVAKGIGELSTTVCGRVDAIALTGGAAHSKPLTEAIRRRVSFIAPVHVVPGEQEMKALAFGIGRVLRGVETSHVFAEQ